MKRFASLVSSTPFFAVLALALVLVACSTTSTPTPQHEIAPTTDTRRAIAALALEQLGEPYQANKAGPKTFDASGLVHFAYQGAGAQIPRNTQAQLDAGKPIDLAAAQPADLLFFRIAEPSGGDRLLVGLYMQTGEMLMAVPDVQGQTGVSLIDLDDAFWRQRMVGVIRALPEAAGQ